ncbi:glutathione ABC transporter substrate-binding protein [Caproiciproducens galactitolivorans]|uniref:Glutathione-binding protein GsiB n=1 Tax=Caproiciproducens galactitolivorans TaxID=642589 RepID=A0ABT4BUQ9_9FIRM|nr:glutathione ABC transporter substrate-binding protein [Caproiciproducens galactitolivorans]MCY1713813.1 glutathione ABC transporter substrate-binding protein [Caproiciproducens galactitolivorans]
MKIRKKVGAIVSLALVTAMLFSACGSGSTASGSQAQSAAAASTAAKSKDNDMVIAMSESVLSLDPHNLTSTMSISANRSMYECLLTFDKDMKNIVPQLAKSYTVSDDGLVYTFTLQTGVKFTDGTDFNSEAVKANIDRCMDEKNNLKSRRYFAKVKEVKCPDANTVQITLKEPYSVFINKMTNFGIISPKAIKDGVKLNSVAVGTGPYKLKEWDQADHLIVTRNDNYWGTKPGVDSITFKVVPEAGSRIAMLQTGEADMIYPIPPEQIKTIDGTKDIKVESVPSNIVYYVTLNMSHKPFNDVKVRQAMNYAIDKDAFVKAVYGGYGDHATSPMASTTQYYSKQEEYAFNIEKAKELLKEAGYPDGFKTTIWSDNTSDSVKGMQFINQQLAQVGITAEVVPMEGATLNAKINEAKNAAESKIDMWYVNWSPSSGDADGALRSLFYSQMIPPANANTAYYSNPAVDKLLDQGLSETKPDKLTSVYAEAQKTIWNDAPWLFLGQPVVQYGIKNYVSNVYMMADGSIDCAQATLAH